MPQPILQPACHRLLQPSTGSCRATRHRGGDSFNLFKLHNDAMTLHRRTRSGHRLAASLVVVLTLLAAGDAPAGLAIALNSADGTISLIDTETYTVTGKANVCKEPHHLMPTPDDKSVIVACAAANQLVFFDPHTGQEQKRIR
ncbi:MAG: hypothetical protein MUC51_03260, partial [Anaerolineae bacterium]|nr:hypothetical protein [Anaerolineae bacterium]